MQPPAPDNASMEEGDPLPCPEDEEFFESRPDAADMEEAISKFMEGALHNLLQGLPVPVQKNASSMTPAEAFQGGFLRDLDKDEKKRFTPLELLLYKHAVEYRHALWW